MKALTLILLLLVAASSASALGVKKRASDIYSTQPFVVHMMVADFNFSSGQGVGPCDVSAGSILSSVTEVSRNACRISAGVSVVLSSFTLEVRSATLGEPLGCHVSLDVNGTTLTSTSVALGSVATPTPCTGGKTGDLNDNDRMEVLGDACRQDIGATVQGGDRVTVVFEDAGGTCDDARDVLVTMIGYIRAPL